MKTHQVEIQKVGETRKPKRGLPAILKAAAVLIFLALIVPVSTFILLTVSRLTTPPPVAPEVLIVTVEVTRHPTASPTPTPAPTATPESVKAVLTGSVWLRETASITSPKVVALWHGDTVVVLAVEGERCKVRWRSGEAEVEGWVAKRWVEETQ